MRISATSHYRWVAECLTRSATLFGLLALACAQPLRADLISVAFNSPNQFGPSPLISGPESAATAANPLFGAASVWNNLNIPFGLLNANPAWNNLNNSTGGATGVNFAITGTVLGVDLYPFFSNPDPLRTEFIAWNSWSGGGGAAGPGESLDISWVLSGLVPNAVYDMCVYGSHADVTRSFDMSIGGVTQNIPTYVSGSSQTADCTLFTQIDSGPNGTIAGIGSGVGDSTTATNEADWSGFQLVEVDAPEPSSLILFGPGALGLLGGLRKRLRR